VKRLLPILVFLLISTVAFSQEIITGKVVSIADGDTFTILVDIWSMANPIALWEFRLR
jgi:endonuclease YncB( thermonuclease family)